MKCTSHTRTLVCLTPKNHRKVVKCMGVKKRPPLSSIHEEIKEETIHDSQLKCSKQWFNREKEVPLSSHIINNLSSLDSSQLIYNNEPYANDLYERMQLLAREEYSQEDFRRQTYDSYSLILYQHLITELNIQRLEMKYISLFGDKWRNKDELYRIEQRIDTSTIRIGRFKSRERAFKKKYFQDENYIIKGIDI